jgi:ATP-binding cassette subfamily C protein
MRLLLFFVRAYPRRTLMMLSCLLLSAIAEGVGLSSLLPLLRLAAQTNASPGPSASHEQTSLGHAINTLLIAIGLQPSVGLLLCIIVGGMLVKAGFVLLAQKQVGYSVAQMATDLRLALLRALLKARWAYFIRQPVGSLANAFATEANRAAQSYLYAATMLSLCVEVALYTSLALVLSWQATLAPLAVGLFIVYVLRRLVQRARRAGKQQTSLLKALLEQLTDVLFAVKPLKAMARETLLGLLLEKETQRLNRAFQREVLSKEMLRALQEPLVVSSLAGGLYFALTRWALPLDSLIVLAVLFGQLLSSLNKVQKQYQSMVSCESAFWSLRATITLAEREGETAHGGAAPTLEKGIMLKKVSLSYGEHRVLREVSLSIPARQVTALIGPSGAGKTSIADVLIGLVRPQAGEVCIDALAIDAVDLQRWRRMVGYVPQEMFLLHESVFVNITLGDPLLTEADVERALRAAGAWEFVAALPEGMQTTVGERGARFSGGQRQRIAIARALVHQPRFLILDEATASLDPESEAAVCATVRRLRGEMTVLVISHQPALLEVADLVYHLDRGVVTQLDRQRLAIGTDIEGREREASLRVL